MIQREEWNTKEFDACDRSAARIVRTTLKFAYKLFKSIKRMGYEMVKEMWNMDRENKNENMKEHFASTNIFSRKKLLRNCIDRNEFDNNVKMYCIIIISKRLFLLNILSYTFRYSYADKMVAECYGLFAKVSIWFHGCCSTIVQDGWR